MKTALIVGACGQDGRYLTRLLLAKGYRVVGAIRPGREAGPDAIDYLPWPTSPDQIADVLTTVKPDEVYNFAGRTSGVRMFDDAVAIGDSNGIAVTCLLDAIRLTNPKIRFAQASSSEMFGRAASTPQSEKSPFKPRSPYGAAKLYAHAMIDIYRQYYGLFAVSAILYNHESPLRRPEFVTRKVSMAAAAAANGVSEPLLIGDLNAKRDWGFAGDTVDAMWRMLQTQAPVDCVVATGLTHSVADLCRISYRSVGLDWEKFVRSDAKFARITETVELCGDASLLKETTGWRATVSFEEMVKTMVRHDLRLLAQPGLKEYNFDEL